jgi:transposase
MGGSGGLSMRELEALEKMAKERIQKAQQASQPEKRSVFISFASEDLNAVNALRAQTKKKDSELEFIDRSLKDPFDSKNVDYIKRGIRERIRQASVTIVYLTESTAGSQWVEWEIEESLRQNKGIRAVYSGAKPPSTIPSVVKKHKIKVIPWEHEILMREIEKAAKKRS